jgi:hypothetical protein
LHENLGLGVLAHQRRDCLDAVLVGQLDVHQDEIRLYGASPDNRVACAPRFADGLHVRGGVDDHSQSAPDDRVIVDDQRPGCSRAP